MSAVSIAPYFPFRRVNIVEQTVTPRATEAHILAEPDKCIDQYPPELRPRGFRTPQLGSRTIRDLSFATAQTWITCRYRKLLCAHCHGIHIEELELFRPGQNCI